MASVSAVAVAEEATLNGMVVDVESLMRRILLDRRSRGRISAAQANTCSALDGAKQRAEMRQTEVAAHDALAASAPSRSSRGRASIVEA